MMREIKYIIVHCTGTVPSDKTDAEVIDKNDRRDKGWSMIGYHYLIKTDGECETGRPLFMVGAHCRGYNKNSIGIAYVGGVDPATKEFANTMTPAQERSLRSLIKELKSKFPQAKILGHRDLDKGKACPCFDVGKWLEHCRQTEEFGV